jgi:hypothetical protein
MEALRTENEALRKRIERLEAMCHALLENQDALSLSIPPAASDVSIPQVQRSPVDPLAFPSLSKPSSGGSPRPSFSDVMKRLKAKEDEKPAMIKSLAILQRRKSPHSSASPVDLKHNVRRIYVSNLPRLRLSELKKHLYALHFALSKILNISYVGKSIVEFTVMEEYEASMKAHLKRCELPILEEYHPGKAYDPKATTEIANAVLDAFKARLAHLAKDSARPPMKAFFEDWLQAVSSRTSLSPIPAPMSAPIDEEPSPNIDLSPTPSQ